MRFVTAAALVCSVALVPVDAPAQQEEAGPRAPTAEEVSSPEALIASLYGTFQRRPGENIDWDRFATFFLPDAVMVPNVEQTDGDFRIMSVADFRAWIEGIFAEHSPIGSDRDHGLVETEVHAVIERYGDIAQAMSTYERRPWDSEVVDGRGINAITLVHNGGRWWIASIVWDEESGAGPVPERYMPRD